MSIELYDEYIPYNEDSDKPEILEFYTLTWYKAPAVIVLPGGGYNIHAEHEAVPVAEFYNTKGFHSFVLKYRLLPNLYPAALCDLQALIKYLRANAEELKVDPDRVFVIGFSAGGHLAALSAVSEDVCKLNNSTDEFSHRPSGVLLGYPVVNTDHPCVKLICGNDEALYDKLSIDKQVTGQTPQMFIWHTSDDEVVDVRHTLKLATSLRQSGVKYEIHIFPTGNHGLGLAKLKKDVSGWAQLSVDWIMNNF